MIVTVTIIRTLTLILNLTLTPISRPEPKPDLHRTGLIVSALRVLTKALVQDCFGSFFLFFFLCGVQIAFCILGWFFLRPHSHYVSRPSSMHPDRRPYCQGDSLRPLISSPRSHVPVGPDASVVLAPNSVQSTARGLMAKRAKRWS